MLPWRPKKCQESFRSRVERVRAGHKVQKTFHQTFREHHAAFRGVRVATGAFWRERHFSDGSGWQRWLPSAPCALADTISSHVTSKNYRNIHILGVRRRFYACFTCRMREWEHGWAQNRAVNGKKRASGFGMAPWRVMMACSHRIKVHICKLTYYIGHGCCPCTFRACFVARMLEWEHAEGCRERSKL